ncbi:MAG: type II toxin-antitoxin system HicA family toxin [Clostridia bacterium]|nr:type II toxin-antitoxin system HicA family toxin [Clostridia bacterium]
MSKIEKQIERLKSKPKDYTYEEAKNLLNKLGFFENNKGKTSGSRVEFKDTYGRKIMLHKPHPSNIIKMYKVNDMLNDLIEWRLI